MRHGYCILIRPIRDIETEQEHSHNVPERLEAKKQRSSSFASELMDSHEFVNYIEHHGYHFTDRLADWATRQIVNANGEKHNWSSVAVAKALEQMRSKMPSFITDGDLAFAANMCYADYYPSLAKTEEDCLKYAVMTATDPDGYDGMIFSRWLTDIIQTQKSVDWGKVI